MFHKPGFFPSKTEKNLSVKIKKHLLKLIQPNFNFKEKNYFV